MKSFATSVFLPTCFDGKIVNDENLMKPSNYSRKNRAFAQKRNFPT